MNEFTIPTLAVPYTLGNVLLQMAIPIPIILDSSCTFSTRVRYQNGELLTAVAGSKPTSFLGSTYYDSLTRVFYFITNKA